MKRKKMFALLGCAALLILGSAYLTIGNAEDAAPAAAKADAKTHEYVGSKACGMCHKGAAKGEILEIWEKSAHATALSKLPADSQKDAKCLACHATGFGKPGGYDPAAETNAAGLDGVGCEACHGPGKDYKGMSVMKDPAKAKEAGLIMPTEDTCKGCHVGTFPEGHKEAPKFDFATMNKKIEHHIPKK